MGDYPVGGKDAEAPGRCEYWVCYSSAKYTEQSYIGIVHRCEIFREN